jgi:hypothetical protein
MKTRIQPLIIVVLFFIFLALAIAFFTIRTLFMPQDQERALVPCAMPCTPDSAYLTAVISASTPPANVSIFPEVGDLGWGAVHGQVTDAVTGQPMEGVKVQCLHSSLHEEYSCEGTTVTDAEGHYIFAPVYFNSRDYISLIFEAPGYVQERLEEGPMAAPDVPADAGLYPDDYPTRTYPAPVCSPPPCENGQLACGLAEGCIGGCGTVCRANTVTP